jgi:hypothetical protein
VGVLHESIASTFVGIQQDHTDANGECRGNDASREAAGSNCNAVCSMGSRALHGVAEVVIYMYHRLHR